MKLPFVSRKKYETARNNYKVAMQGQSDLRKKYVDAQTKVNEYLNLYEGAKEELKLAKKEVQRLKMICTKNGVTYKKEEK